MRFFIVGLLVVIAIAVVQTVADMGNPCAQVSIDDGHCRK